MTEYDLIILGAGPAGLTAAIYAARYKMKALVLGTDIGGTANKAHDVQNWPGFQGNGMELMDNFTKHAKSLGAVIDVEQVEVLGKEGDDFVITTNKRKHTTGALLIATGTKRRKLGIPGEDELFGKGVSYCATCDCHFYKDKTVAVVGGSNCAAMAAQILVEHASKVIVVYRGERMRAETARVEELEANEKVEFRYGTNVAEILGENNVEKVKLDNGDEIEVDGVFIEIGGIPTSEMSKELGVELDQAGRIIVNSEQETNVKGVFAAGDVSTASNGFDQIVTAAAEGAMAVLTVFKEKRKQNITCSQ